MNKIDTKSVSIAVVAFLLGAVVMHMSARTGMNHFGMRGDSMHQMQNGEMMKDEDMMMGKSEMSMSGMMDSMNANLKGKTGVELEKAFLTDMIVHHQGAVDMAKLLVSDTTIKPELAAFGNKIITAQEAEIIQMKAWLEAY